MAGDRGQVCLGERVKIRSDYILRLEEGRLTDLLFSFTVMPGLGPGYFFLNKLVTEITAYFPVFGTI